MEGDLSVTARHIDGGTLRWSLTRFVYSFVFTLISVIVTAVLTIFVIPIALLLPQGIAVYALLLVLTAIRSGELITRYKIEISLPDIDNLFRREAPGGSIVSTSQVDSVIIGLMVAAGATGLFIIALIAGAAVSYLSPVGSLLVPAAILLFDRHIYTKYNKSLTFSGANLIKMILRSRESSGRGIKKIDILHTFAVGLLGISYVPTRVSNSA